MLSSRTDLRQRELRCMAARGMDRDMRHRSVVVAGDRRVRIGMIFVTRRIASRNDDADPVSFVEDQADVDQGYLELVDLASFERGGLAQAVAEARHVRLVELQG